MNILRKYFQIYVIFNTSGLALGEEEEGRGLGQVAQAAVGLGLVTEDPMDEGIGQGSY